MKEESRGVDLMLYRRGMVCSDDMFKWRLKER
jgi:hypothetical protein